MIKAVAGAGGKTTLIHYLAEQYCKQGKKVFICTSTHMYIEEDTLLSDCSDEIIDRLNKTGYVMAGIKDGNKIGPLSYKTYKEVCRHADEVLIEADGSAHYPLKFLRENEPVIYDNVDEIIVVCGLHALGKKAKDAVFRLGLSSLYYKVEEDDVIDGILLQNIVEKGYVEYLKEIYKDKKITLCPMHNHSLYERVLAVLLKEHQDVSLIKEEWFNCSYTLVICGGGHVSMSLVRLAKEIGFYVVVIDDREDLMTKERFPYADEIICDSFDHLDRYLKDNAFYVVVTREHKDDFKCVKTILTQSSYQYLGMIGSRKKIHKTFDNLRNSGISDKQLDTIQAPIGLDILARTPIEIAVSICAELILFKNRISVSSISHDLVNINEDGVLCIIIDKQGSSPRGIGSMMFVGKECIVDSIGGGAVEYQAIKDARSIKRVEVKRYSLNDKEKMDLGMICGGVNTVLFVPLYKDGLDV